MDKITRYVLNRLPTDLVTDTDLAAMIPGSDSRYSLVKRAVGSGEILRLRRGLYCLSKENRRKRLNTFAVSQILYGPSYVSLESALSYHGWIPEGVFMTTCVSLMRKTEFKTPVGDFAYFPVPQRCFYEEVQKINAEGDSAFLANPFKALCDYVYVHKKDWSGIDPLLEDLRIETQQLTSITTETCARLYDNYRSRRVLKFIKSVKKDLGL